MSERTEIPHSKPWIDAADVAAVDARLASRLIADGSAVEAFEFALAEALGVPRVHCAASGTSALVIALTAVGLSDGDEVVLPTYVCDSVINAVTFAGGTPVLADVGPHWTMTPETAALKVGKRTRAIVVPATFGFVEPVAGFLGFGVPIVNDLAQAFDAGLSAIGGGDDRGDISVYSFHATKCLTSGTGGAVTAHSPEWLGRIEAAARSTRQMACLSDMQAALGLSQLRRYDSFRRRRRTMSDAYLKALPPAVTRNISDQEARWHRFRFPLTLSGIAFDAFAERMASRGVAVRRGVDSLLHRTLNMRDDEFPNAVRRFETTASIPFYPSLAESEAQAVLDSCIAALEAKT